MSQTKSTVLLKAPNARSATLYMMNWEAPDA